MAQKSGVRNTAPLFSTFVLELQSLRGKNLKNGVSDIFSGLTADAIVGRYHHDKSYWKGNALEGETIAHFFEAMAAGGKKLEILKNHFPSAFAYFEEAL